MEDGPSFSLRKGNGLSGPLGAKQAEVGWGGRGVGDAAVIGGWVRDSGTGEY